MVARRLKENQGNSFRTGGGADTSLVEAMKRRIASWLCYYSPMYRMDRRRFEWEERLPSQLRAAYSLCGFDRKRETFESSESKVMFFLPQLADRVARDTETQWNFDSSKKRPSRYFVLHPY